MQHFRKYISKSMWNSLEFPQQTLGIDYFLFSCITVPTSNGNKHPTSSCWNFIPTLLRGNEIPWKWRENEIPTNHPLELYTIYNPASRTVSLVIFPTKASLIFGPVLLYDVWSHEPPIWFIVHCGNMVGQVITMSNLNPSWIELELGFGFDNNFSLL